MSTTSASPIPTTAPTTQTHPRAETSGAAMRNSADGAMTATKTKVSVVIPVYNEAETVQTLVELVVKASLPPGCTREIICVNDCSTDGTAAKLDELPRLFPDAEFQIHHKPVNEGKGAALRDGFAKAGGDIVL